MEERVFFDREVGRESEVMKVEIIGGLEGVMGWGEVMYIGWGRVREEVVVGEGVDIDVSEWGRIINVMGEWWVYV